LKVSGLSATFHVKQFFIKKRHGSILGGSLKACPERSRMGAAWGWQSSKSGVTIPKSFPGYGLAFAETSGFKAATHYGVTNQCYPESLLFEPCQGFRSFRNVSRETIFY